MLNMSKKIELFLQEYLPETLNMEELNDVLDLLSDLITFKGFDINYDLNAFGKEAQTVYDDLYYSNE